LKGKIAIITGSTSGIGKDIAKDFARSGASVIISGRDENKAELVVQEIKREGGIAVAVIGDVTEREIQKKLVDTAVSTFGGLDILVNNSAIYNLKPFESFPEKVYDDHFNTNVKAPFYLTQYALPHITPRKGNIINISSVTSKTPVLGDIVYNMNKGALDVFTKTLALTLASSGVRVNSVSPAAIQTPMLSEIPETALKLVGLRAHPIGRIGQPEDIASVVLFLASDLASFITGVDWVVDGGNLLQNSLNFAFQSSQ